MSHTTSLTSSPSDVSTATNAPTSTYTLDTRDTPEARGSSTFVVPAFDDVEALDADPYTAAAQERRYPLEVITDELEQQRYEALGLPAQDWCYLCDTPANITGMRDAVESVIAGEQLYSRVLTVVDLACGHTTTENH